MCPTCGEDLTYDVDTGQLGCVSCGLTVTQFAQDLPEGNRLEVGDYVAHRVSDGSWSVTLGDHLTIGTVRPFGFTWWAAVRHRSIVDAEGSYWGDWGPPEILGWANTLHDCVAIFGQPPRNRG